MEGGSDLNQALQKHLLWLLSHQPKTFPGLVGSKELTGTIVLEAFRKCALGPIEFHPPASCVKLTLYGETVCLPGADHRAAADRNCCRLVLHGLLCRSGRRSPGSSRLGGLLCHGSHPG